MRMQTVAAAGLIAGMCAMTTGCRVDKHRNGDAEDVKIATPFGGVSVKTNETGAIDGLGLPVYPGAQMVKKQGDEDGSADVNMSFGKFQLRIKTVSFRTADSPDKVEAFYRKALARYGTILDCVKNQPVGATTRTAEGLTCDDSDRKKAIKTDVDDVSKHDLKAGSRQHQHIVGINPDGPGTKFGLVALDLPGSITFSDDSDSSHKDKEKVQ